MEWGTAMQTLVLRLALAGAATAPMIMAATPAAAVAFDIPGGSLARGLADYQAQSGAQIIYRKTDLGQAQTRGVHGDLPAQTALDRLLAGTHLAARRDPTGAVALIRISQAEAAPQVPLSPPAQAQRTAAPDPAPAAAAVEEILVTAQKRSENLQDVPISVTAVTGRQIEAMGVQTSADIGVVTPGLNYTVATGYAAPFLRGIGTNNVGPGVESPVATYVDGVYYGSLTASVFALDSIAQIEVLKGPQGTLFGRNATAGVIQITTREPEQRFSGDASVGYGNYRTSEAKFYVTGGLTDRIAANLTAYYQDQGEGYGRNLVSGLDTNRTSTFTARAKVRADLGENTTADLILDYAYLRTSEGISWRPLDGATTILGTQFTGGQQDIASDIQPLVIDKQRGVSVRVNHSFERARFVSISAYREEDVSQNVDNDYGLPIKIAAVHITTKGRQLSQELQLQSPDGAKVQWVVGAFGFYSSGAWRPLQAFGLFVAPLDELDVHVRQQAFSGALFGQTTFEVLPDTNLTLGARYTVEKRELSHYRTGILGGTDIGTLTSTSGEKTFDSPTWRIALDHRFGPDALGYLSYNRGFKSGQFDTLALPTKVVKPETVDSFEVGYKSTFFDRRLRLNGALFYSRYKDMQIPTYGQGESLVVLRNAAEAEIYGLDLDGELVINSDLSFTGGLELLHSEYSSFPDSQVSIPAAAGGNVITVGDATGNRTMLTPKVMAFLSANWHLPVEAVRLDANLTYSYNGGWYADPDNRLRQKSFNQVNAKLAWTLPGDQWKLIVWGRNLTDEVFAQWLSGSPATTDVYTASAPRTYGLTISRDF